MSVCASLSRISIFSLYCPVRAYNQVHVYLSVCQSVCLSHGVYTLCVYATACFHVVFSTLAHLYIFQCCMRTVTPHALSSCYTRAVSLHSTQLMTFDRCHAVAHVILCALLLCGGFCDKLQLGRARLQ